MVIWKGGFSAAGDFPQLQSVVSKLPHSHTFVEFAAALRVSAISAEPMTEPMVFAAEISLSAQSFRIFSMVSA
jgi:hypothetical protein